MNNNDEMIRKVFDLGDIDVDQDALAQEIRDRVEKRPFHPPPNLPQFAVTPPTVHETATLPPDLHTALHLAATSYDQIWITTPPEPPRRAIIPYIKHQLHQLAVFYANKLGEKQIDTNEQLIRSLNVLSIMNHQQNQEIAALQQQVNQLQEQVARLEQS